MKETTGELNVTVIVVILIGLLSALFFSFVWPTLRGSFRHNESCAKAVCEKCPDGDPHCPYRDCYIQDPKDPNKKSATFRCPNKG